MGVRIMWNHDDTKAVLYCSVSDWAFGPLFTDDNDMTARENAQSFLTWLRHKDPRSMTDNELEKAYADWGMRDKTARCVLPEDHFGEHMLLELKLQARMPGECGAKEN